MRSNLSSDLNFQENTVLQQIVGVIADAADADWQRDQAVYNSQYISLATGISLDRAVESLGLFRLAARSTRVSVAFKGQEETVIPQSTVVRVANSVQDFITEQEFTITQEDAIRIIFEISTVADNTSYTITINGDNADFTSGSGATKQSIAQGLQSALDDIEQPIDVTVTNDNNVQVDSNNFLTTYSGTAGSNLSIIELWSFGEMFAENAGPIEVSVGTLTNIQTPVAGLDAVNNFLPGQTGRNRETDSELRDRALESASALGETTIPAIESKMLQEVEGVTTVFVIENEEITPDPEGRPPKSFETVVEGGQQQEIARFILEHGKAAGIQTTGNINVLVEDASTNPHRIYFSRPVDDFIWVDVELTVNNDWVTGSETQVEDDIVEHGRNTFGIGDDILWQDFFCAVYQTNNILSATIKIGVTDNATDPKPTMQSQNISVQQDHLGRFDAQRVSVQVV